MSLSNVPAPIRHLIVVLFGVAADWISTVWIPSLHGQTGYGALIGGIVMVLLAWATPLVQSYGVGYRPPALRS